MAPDLKSDLKSDLPSALPPALESCWILTDGKIGDEAPCIGVAEELGLTYELRHVHPRKFFAWFMPRGPIDPREAPDQPESPLAPPFPDIAIGSGRRAIAYLRRLKKESGGKTFTICLKDPRTGTSAADFIWVPEHDRLRGDNVLVTPTSPHRFSATRLTELKAAADPRIDALRPFKVAVLIGGNSRHHSFTPEDCQRLAGGLKEVMQQPDVSLMITLSRRTPAELEQAIKELVSQHPGHFLWDGSGDNPYGAMLAKAEALIATADSTNMIGEAACTGKPIHVFEPTGGHAKISRFLGTLRTLGVTHPFPGALKSTTYEPLNATPQIATAIREALSQRVNAPT